MKKLMILVAVSAAILMTGCSVTKVNYKKDADGICEYRIYHNDHWLKRETGAMSGGMTTDGKFEVKLESANVSPSEEFNKTMQTYTTAFVQLAQIAAAAYNPSASLAAQGADPTAVAKLVEAQSAAKTAEIAAKSQRETANIKATSDAAIAQKQAAGATASADCKDGTCSDGTCTDGSCTVK